MNNSLKALYILIVCSCLMACSRLSLFDNFAGITTKNCTVEMGEDGIEVTTTDQKSSVIFSGQWDLSKYARLKLTVTNKSEKEYMTLNVKLKNEKTQVKTRPYEGITEDRLCVAPASTETFCIDLPCEMPHPEVNRLFSLMRGTPYGEFKHLDYNVNLTDVRSVELQSYRLYPGSRWSIDKIEFVSGKKAETPDYMLLDSAAFFPCFDRYGQFKYRDWPGKIHSDSELEKARIAEAKDLEAHPGPGGWNKYGGWADGPHYEATGHFRVQKIDGKWWMIDPEGCLFWSHGIVRVNPSSSVTPLHGKNLASRSFMFEDLPQVGDSLYRFRFTNDALLAPYYERRQEDSTYDFSSANLWRKYGREYKTLWSDLAHRRLLSWGFNTVANSSDIDICRMDRTPFTDRFDVRSKPIAGADGSWFPIMDPFDKSFRLAIEDSLKNHRRDIEDPYLLGYFVDNEIRWGNSTHAARCVSKSPEDQAAKTAMKKWLKSKYGKAVKPENASEEDLKEFNLMIIEKYYSVIREAFDKYAPNVLYMGCRFASFIPSNEDVIRIGAKYCDVISYNQYRYDMETFHLPEGIDKPVMIGEWHVGALDRGMFHHSLLVCKDQEERGYFYERYAVSAIKNPIIIGIHWHQFMDQATSGRFDGENFQVGFLDCCDTPYMETVNAARRAGYTLYETRYKTK